MKQKQFFFALVAMLSFVFSGFAQTTVTTEAQLKAALESAQGGSVVLGNNIELSAQVTIPKKSVHTLDLNGKKITGGLYVYGTLTINDGVGTGELTASTYVLNGAGGSKIILNGGKVYRGSSWSVYTTGVFTVNGGVVENSIRVAGSGTIELNGGTVTNVQVTSGNLKITDSDATVAGNLNIEKGAKSVNISAGTINGDVTIATEAQDKVAVSGGSFKDADAIKDYLPSGSALLQKPDGTYEIVAGLLKIGDTYYPTLDAALKAAQNGATIELINQEGAVIAINGSLYGKSVTITGTAKVDWNKGFLFVGRGGEGNATLTFDNANLTSASNSSSYGIHVSGREKDTNNKYDGTLVIKNSTIELDYLINRGAMTLDNSTLTVKNGFGIAGRPASETESNVAATATITLKDNAKLFVNNHNGMGLGQAASSLEGFGIMNVNSGSTFETTQGFKVTANGTMNVDGGNVKIANELTNNGTVYATGASKFDAKVTGEGWFYMNGVALDANTKLDGAKVAFINGENTVKGSTIKNGWFSVGIGQNAEAEKAAAKGFTMGSVVVNVSDNATIGGNGKPYSGWVGSAYSANKTQHTYTLNVNNSLATFGYFHISKDGILKVNGHANNKYTGDGANVDFYAGEFIINGAATLNGTDAWAKYTKMSVDHADGVLNITGDTKYEASIHNGGTSSTSLKFWKAGKVNVEAGTTVEIDNGTVLVEGAELNIAGNVTAKGTVTGNGAVNLTAPTATFTAAENIPVNATGNYVVVYNNGVYSLVASVAQIGGTAYTSIDEAFAKATEGQTITLINDATPVLTSQRAITKAAVIDLGGKTLTLKEDDLYFGTTTFKNGTIVVDPSVKASTAVFWMFANQTLTFDNVKIVATGVTGTYLIGLDGNNSDLNLLNGSEILVENTTALDLDIICVNASTGNDIKVENSKVNVTNLDGRVFFRGNYTVKDSEVNLAGITKAGFRIEAGQTLSIEGTSKVNIEGEPRDGGINLIGATASYTKAETATVNATVTETGFEAKIGDDKYTTFNEAVADAQDGAEVTIHKAGTYNVPSGKNLTITGAVDGVQFGPIAEPNLGMKNYTFNNVTFNYANDSHYKGLQYAGEMEYNNCTFNGQVFLYGQKETFNKCTFYQTTNNYNVWTYSAKEVAFNECTFNSAGKSVLIYHESATVFNNVAVAKSTFNASQAVDGKAAIEMDASLTAGINLTIDDATTATGFATGNVSGNALWNNKKGNADEANNDITVVVAGVTVLAPVFDAKIGEKGYRNLQDAINAVKDGETVVLAQDFTGNITLTEKVGLYYTIDGAGKQFKGSISVNSLSDTNDNRRITIKNIKFVDTADANVDFISSVNTNHYPRLTIEGCTFTGSGNDGDVAVRLKSSHSVVIKDCTATGLHSFIQNTSGWNLTIENVNVTNSKSAFALGTVQGVTVKGVNVDVKGYGIRMDANTYNNNAVIEGNNVTAFIPVVVRKVNTQSNVTFTGENTFTAYNNDGKWMVIGTTEYEENGKLPAETAEGNVVVALNDANLSYEGVHGAGLAGKGTADAPYLINNVAELELFRNSVNAGSAKYSKPGLCVALNADIDMTGVNWVGIGTATADHGFMGNFDGKNFKIKKLTITNPALDSDGYAYAGLFGVTEGTNKDNQNTIKNLTIENVTINTTGHIAAAAIAYPYYTIVENVKVCGNIAITGGNYTAGVLAYTRRCVNASNLSIVGNDGSYVKGAQTVGGVISDIQMNGGLTAVYSNFSAEGISVTGEKSVGGIAGIIATQTLNGATVKNVTLNSQDAFAGVVAGRLGGTSTISNVVSENVTGATAVIGATFDGAKAVEARIGDTYYSAFAAAYTAAKAGETVTMLTDLNMSEILVLDKAITLDGNGKTLTSTASRAINVGTEGNVGIKNLTINASGERAINVIQKPANVTIENVTATAANYTVNLASSAGAAKVAISNSNLTGLNVVNVAAAGSEITINGGTITCNDQNANENYAALTMNKDAVGAKIAATSVTFDIKGDSKKASNGAVDGEITIDGSTDEVAVNVAYISYGNNYYSFTSIEAAIEAAKAGETIGLIRDITASDIITINKAITLDGNGKTLTSTAGRAINVSGADGATIKNLTIDAKGERAINVIQNATNVIIDGVTATAKNYTVNVAASAPNAKVAIKNSTLNGLCTVNVSAAGAQVTVDKSTVNCNDNNTTAGEAYAALSLNKEAVGGSIVATNATINVTDGSDSMKGRNGAENGTVTINGSTDDVAVMVAIIEYAGSTNYHAFATLEKAIEFAKAGDVVSLIRDITASGIITINKAITLDGNGKTLTSTAGRAINVDCEGNVGIKNLTINAKGERAINVIQKPANVTIDSVTATAANYTVNLATSAGAAKVAINGSNLTGLNVVNVGAPGSEITINGGTITCNDQNDKENYAALVLSKEAKNGKITADGVTFDIKGDSKKASNAATGGVITIDGSTDDVSVVVAYISYGNNSYTFTSIEEAIKFAKAGDVVTIMPGEYNKALNVNKAGITVQGETDAEGNNLVKFNAKLNITANGAAVKNITVKNSGTAAYINAADVLVENCNLEGSNGLYQSYAKGTVTFKNSVITGGTYGVHFDGSTGGNIVIEGCTITGWTSFAGTIANVEISKTTFADGNYDQLRFYQNATLKECVFNENMTVDFGKNTIEAEFTECTVENGKPLTDVIYLGDIAEGVKVTIDDKQISVQAKAGNNYYQTLLEAVGSAKTGETVTLLTDVALDTKTLATQNDGYATIVNVAGKAVTLDLNGKKITVDAAAADLASAKGGMLLAVFSADLGGHLTLTDNTDAKNGAVTLNVNDAKVYGMFVSESKESDKSNSGKITVEAGNYATNGKVSNAMFFADANEVITVNGGNFHCYQVSNTANYPWMFNTVGNNELHVTVNGGTFNVDINHQLRPFEVKVPDTLAVKANGDGTWTVVEAEAYITEMLGAFVNEAGEWAHKVGYATIAEAIAAVNELGNKVSIAKDLELTETVVVPADKTMVLDLNGKTVTMNDASGAAAALLKNNGNLTITDGTEAKAGKLSFKTTTPSAANAYASNTISNYGTLTIEGGNVENLSVGGGACYALDNYAGSTATINGGKLTAEKTAVRIFNWTDGEAAKATINMNGGEIYSKNGYGINVNSGNKPFVALNIAGGTITTDYADYKLAVYVVNKNSAENLTINVTGGTFNGIFALNGVTAKTMKQDAVAVSGGTFEGVTCYDDPAYGFVSGGTFKSAVDAKAVATGFICKDNGDGTFGVIVDPKHGMVAQIIRNDYYAENQYFATINDAVQAAITGETVTLIADVETSAEELATIGEENYAVIVAVKEKDITLNLNGKSVTVTPTAEELANANGKMLMSVFGMDTNGKLTLTGNGSVKVNANGANVYSLVAAYGEGSAVVIENGNYEVDTVIASGSLIYSHEMITVMGGTYKLGNIATGANGSPWIFNTVGQNYTGVKVVGGTFPTDINHQFWANEVLVPEAYALQNNGNGTWTVVDAVAYTNEKATSRNASWRHVGYASLEDAIAATGKYNCENNTVTMIKDIALEPITIANGVKVAIDLNGKTISGTDNGTASYGLITNKGDLTINGTGTIQLTATQNRGWSAYSSVISNQVGGKLTVNGGTIEHLGGTSMAWGIDNLTNGKGTYAETVINGGVVKSKYIAIRQFLNGVEADNILTVNGGTLEGETASLYFQDPSKNANTGTLNVLDGTLAGDVYLDVTEGSTEWPVEVYIAKAALGQNDIHADNVPAEAAALVEYDTFWQVEQKNLAELTIEDACEEYINKIEKNVGELTYKRYFNDTEWQTIVLPFDVPVANLTEQFEVAYIYNAKYKGKQANIDYVVIDENSAIETLRANYPYMIRAKEAGWNNIVVEGAKLMPTEVEILDCSSVFEKFSFIGSYATVDTETLDATKGYFNLISGAWSQLGTVNPFRFYMQIEKRDGSAFEYPGTEAKAIRMRQVDANGEATGIDSVGAVTEQNSGLIFDLHGRRVVDPKKGGLYIVNGKKVVF